MLLWNYVESSKKIERICTTVNVLNHNDGRMERFFQYYEPFMQERDVYKIEEMNFTLNTLAPSLQTIATYLFTSRREANKSYYVAVLFMYCIKIDEYFRKKNQKDYKSDLIVDALVNILINIDYNIPKSYCSIL